MRLLLMLLGITASMSAFSFSGNAFVKAVENRDADSVTYGMAMGYLTGVMRTTDAFGFFQLCPDLQLPKVSDARDQIVGRVYLDRENNGNVSVELLYIQYLVDEELLRPMVENSCI